MQKKDETNNELPLPLEIPFYILRYLKVSGLSSFSRVHRNYRDLAHVELFSRRYEGKDAEAQEHLLKYWCKNPETLLKHNCQRLIVKLKEYVNINTRRHTKEILTRVYTCLAILTAFENNVAAFEENFYRLALVTTFNPDLLLAVLVKIIVILKDNQSYTHFQSFLNNNISQQSIKNLLAADVPIDNTLSRPFLQNLLSVLESAKSNPIIEEIAIFLMNVHELLTSEEAFKIINLLLNDMFDTNRYAIYEHLPHDKNQQYKENLKLGDLLKKLLQKLTNNQIDQLFDKLSELWLSNDNDPVKIGKISYLIIIFSRRFSLTQRYQCCISLMAFPEHIFQKREIINVFCDYLKQCETTEFLPSLRNLVTKLYCNAVVQEKLQKLNIVEKSINENKEFNSEAKEEAILFLKFTLALTKLMHPRFYTYVIKHNVHKKISVLSAKLVIKVILHILTYGDDKFLCLLLVNILSRKDIESFPLCNYKISKKM